MSPTPRPPRIARFLLRRLIEPGILESALEELDEQFEYTGRTRGWARARREYRRQAAAALPGFLKNTLLWSLTMFGNYLKVFLRGRRRRKMHAVINFAGLTIGFAVFLLIWLFVRHETGVDRFHDHRDRVYRVQGEGGQPRNMSPAVANWISGNIPEAEAVVRFKFRHDYKIAWYPEGEGGPEKSTVLRDFGWVDPTFFDVFSFELLAGDPAAALDAPYSTILTESAARRIFGGENPIGKSVKVNNSWEARVTGVLRDPRQTHLRFDALTSFETLGQLIGRHELDSFNSWNLPTFVRLPETHDSVAVAAKITDLFQDKLMELWKVERDFELLPLEKVYFSGLSSGNQGNRQFVSIFVGVAFFILLVAGVNFVNLSTARGMLRAREVGIRKVVGSSRRRLAARFLGESVLFSLAALSAAFLLARGLLPSFSAMMARDLSLSLLLKPGMTLLLMAGAMLIGALSGIYPALYLSSFSPMTALRSGRTQGGGSGRLRKALICFQFTISIVLIIGSLVVSRQMRYVKNKDLGFRRDPIVSLEFARNRGIRRRMREFKTRLLQNPAVLGVTFSQGRPGLVYNWEGLELRGEHHGFAVFTIDPDYFDVYGLRIMDGRGFDWERPTDRLRTCLLNEAAVRELGLENPVGTILHHDNLKGSSFPVPDIEVIGVVRDFHFQSLHNEVQPQIFSWNEPWLWMGSIPVASGRETEALEHIRGVWKEFTPDFPFEYHFIGELMDGLYEDDHRFGRMIGSFTALGILIACLGLFGLASFTAERRTREIGIRRVLGASTPGIIRMLSGEFTRWVLIANLAAWPLAYYFLRQWLRNFSFRISPGLQDFLPAAAAALVIAWLTVAAQSLKAASADPVDSLRFE